MDEQAVTFFRQLLEHPSPSGFEQPVQALIRRWAAQYADDVRTDVHGNVIATRNPQGTPRLLLDGHCDQIGLMVQHIDEEGFLTITPIGGWDAQILLGQSVSVWSAQGPVEGIIGRKPTHLLKPDERKKVPEISDLWVDIGAANQEDARSAVSVGDPITVTLGMRRLRRDLVAGPKMDNTAGLFVVFEALRRLHGRELAPALFVVSAVQEEIGLRGTQTSAFSIAPHVGIAVDVTHATDCPTVNKRAHGDVRLGAGPVLLRGPNINPVVFDMLRRLAQEHDLPFQIRGANRATANDTNPLQLTRAGVATGCVAIPNRYMHTPVETVSLADLDAAAELLSQFALAVARDADFTPG